MVKTLRNRNYLGFPDARADTASGGAKLELTGAPLNSEQEVASDEVAKPFQGINSQCLGTQWATDASGGASLHPKSQAEPGRVERSQGKARFCVLKEESSKCQAKIWAAKAGGVGR